MNKIVMYGHSGSGNHGCEAIIRSTRKILGQEYSVFSNSPDQDKKYGLVNNIEKYSNNIPQKSFRRYFYAIYCRVFRNSMIRYKYAYQPFLEKITAGNVYLSVGGDHYCYGSYSNHIYDFLNNKIKNKGAKSVLWSCSIEDKDLDASTIESLKRYDLITARESITYETLKKNGIIEKVHLIPDVAFLLNVTNAKLPEEFCPGNTIGINVSPMVQKYNGSKNIVLKNYESLITYILNNTTCQIALIPHVVWDDTDDRIPLSELYKKYSKTGRVILVEDRPAEEMKYIISQCCFFVGARTHATIAAYSSCVPTLVVGYSVKARGIARDIFGTENGYVIPVQKMKSEEDLLHVFKPLWNKREEISLYLKKIIPSYCERVWEAKSLVEKIL